MCGQDGSDHDVDGFFVGQSLLHTERLPRAPLQGVRDDCADSATARSAGAKPSPKDGHACLFIRSQLLAHESRHGVEISVDLAHHQGGRHRLHRSDEFFTRQVLERTAMLPT